MIYGFYKHDFLMELPNGLGCGSAVLQLIVYFVYRQKFKNKIAADPTQETAKIISLTVLGVLFASSLSQYF